MIRYLLAATLLVAATASPAQMLKPTTTPPGGERTALDQQLAEVRDVAALEAMVVRFKRSGDSDSEARVLRRLTELMPNIGQYKYEMAAAWAAKDYKTLAYNALLELQAQGYAYDIKQDPRFEPVTSTEVWTYTAQAFDENRKPFGEGKVWATLPKQDLLIESVAWDPNRGTALVGSAREGVVYLTDPSGKLKPLAQADADNGMWAVFDLAVDAKRNILWVASTAVPHFKRYDAERDLGKAGIFKFDLKTGKFLKRFLSPVAVGQNFFMSSLALGSDGTLYAADGVNNAVYRVKDDQLKRVFHAPGMVSIRGLAVSGDNKTLYFADYRHGLWGITVDQGARPFPVLGDANLALGGVDGIFWWRGQLAIIQNGMNPKRVMRLKLDETGRRIVGVQPLEANQPALSEPTQGSLNGDQLLLIGNSQKGHYDRFGLPRDVAKLEGTRLYTVDLTFGSNQAASYQ